MKQYIVTWYEVNFGYKDVEHQDEFNNLEEAQSFRNDLSDWGIPSDLFDEDGNEY